jgi:hypothetical protein
MKLIAKIHFEHDLEDGWYRMKEPTGKNDTWNEWRSALKFCNSQDWELVWDGPEDRYMPEHFKGKVEA